jgi:bacteriocin-like protein
MNNLKFQNLVNEGGKLKGGFSTLSDSQLAKIKGGSGTCGNNCKCGPCGTDNCNCTGS